MCSGGNDQNGNLCASKILNEWSWDKLTEKKDIRKKVGRSMIGKEKLLSKAVV